MKYAAFILVIILGSVSPCCSQNLGFEGKKNVLSIGIEAGAKKLVPRIRIERSFAQSWSLVVSASQRSNSYLYQDYDINMDQKSIDDAFSSGQSSPLKIDASQGLRGSFSSSHRSISTAVRLYNLRSRNDFAPLGSYIDLGLSYENVRLNETKGVMNGTYQDEPVQFELILDEDFANKRYFIGSLGFGGEKLIRDRGMLDISLNLHLYIANIPAGEYDSHIDAAHEIVYLNSVITSRFTLNIFYGILF